MKREAVKFLFDMQLAIADIELFMKEAKGFEEYKANKLLKSAVERKLLVIGEAVNKFREYEKQTRIDDVDRIYGLRNRLAHSYDSIDDNTLYAIVVNHLPNLKAEVQKLIAENYKGD